MKYIHNNKLVESGDSSGMNKCEHSSENYSPLLKAERCDFDKYEEIIGKNLNAFFEVGKALAAIKKQRLYREHHNTFEQYCEEKWDFSRFRAYQLINASAVRDKMLTIVNTPLPKNEAQIRPFMQVPEEKIAEIWQDFLHEHRTDSFTAKDISKFIKKHNGAAKDSKRNKCKSANRKNSSLILAFELNKLVKELENISHQYEENEALNDLVLKIHDCSERIQESCLCE